MSNVVALAGYLFRKEKGSRSFAEEVRDAAGETATQSSRVFFWSERCGRHLYLEGTREVLH